MTIDNGLSENLKKVALLRRYMYNSKSQRRELLSELTAAATTKNKAEEKSPGFTAVMVDSELVLTLTFSNRAICDAVPLARALRVELA